MQTLTPSVSERDERSSRECSDSFGSAFVQRVRLFVGEAEIVA